MSKLGLVVLLSLVTGRMFAQNYFVFISSDNRQPFYVRLDSQFYPSSPEGHLIIAPLKDSDYVITIGFPGKVHPERRYSFPVHRKDLEFQLKGQDDGDMKLWDQQAKDWVAPRPKEGGEDQIRAMGIKKDDAFSRMMAEVVQDTAVLYNTYAMEQALADSPAVSGTGTGRDSTPVTASSATIGTMLDKSPFIPAATLPAATLPPLTLLVDTVKALPRGAGVVKLSERRTGHSVRLVYADQTAGRQVDTVVITIPVDTAASPAPETATARLSETAGIRPADTARIHPSDTPQRPQVRPVVPYVNSDCHNFATDYDIDKLRVRMLDAPNDGERVATARKVFKTKCFYTKQLRVLSEVFTSDASKFKFFEAAWPFAADEHFRELSGLLSDPVYLGKFNTMTGGQP
ncbi:MAG TPA: hypothetical protein VNU72_13395 [Puia sp.]|jgi:hypothetical protein|nr:hypothetical protein [Puia sp.]